MTPRFSLSLRRPVRGGQTADEMRQSLKHSGLPPMKHRCSGRDTQRIPAVIEVSVAILHILNRPAGCPEGESERFRISGSEIGERVDRLGRTLNVDGVRALVVILRAAGCFNEVILEKTKAVRQVAGELVVAGLVDVALQAVQIVARVEIVNPMIPVFFRIPPRPVGKHA